MDNIPILDLKPQYQALKAEIHAAINRVLESGAFILGPEVQQFEQEVAAFLGVKHAIGVNSGTDALIISLRCLGIGPGDEVITTPFSFFATAESISNVGAKPVFVDVNLETFNIEPSAIATAITPQTKAIMPVHLFGQPAAMAEIMAIANAHNLAVIEDCAQAFGARYINTDSTYNQHRVGSIGTLGAFSFFPTKNLGAYGDGGLVTTNHDDHAHMARMLRVHGATEKYNNEHLGYNSRLDAMQAAILRVKLPYVEQWNTARCHLANIYSERLFNLPKIITPAMTDGHVFNQYTLRITNGLRDSVKQALAAQGISTMSYYLKPQDQLPVYAHKRSSECINSNQLSTEVISLPIWPELEQPLVAKISDCISKSISHGNLS